MSLAGLTNTLKYRILHQTANAAPAAAAAGGSNEGGSKKDKKEKKGGEEGKKEKQPTRKELALAAQAAAAARTAPVVAHPEGESLFGDLERIQSGYETKREWTDISALDLSKVGNNVWIRARVHRIAAKGKSCFMTLRRGFSSIQIVLEKGANGVTPEFFKYAEKLAPESVVDVAGVVVKAFKPVVSTSQQDVEVSVRRLFCVSASHPVLPFQIEDAARRPPTEQEEKESKTPIITVGTDLRLDNRWIDLRTPANHAIFRLQSRIGEFYRAYFISEGFVEIHTPKITPGVSEGGSDVFKLDYFGSKCCLAQSPQLFKQMAVVSDLFKVFEIGHVFRAENSNTHRHMCEFIGLDFEMEIKESYKEVTTQLGNCFNFIFEKINAHCQPELAAIQKQYPFEPLKWRKETLVLDFKEAQNMLREAGEVMDDTDDFSTAQEKKLGKLVAAKYNTDFYIVDQYPATVRPFYTMPNKHNPNYTNSYDVFLRGEEITSGAQRIHEVELLKERATAKGVPHDNIAAYLESFKYGAYPHGGAGIGLERVVMLFLGLDNIRKTSMFPRTPNRFSP